MPEIALDLQLAGFIRGFGAFNKFQLPGLGAIDEFGEFCGRYEFTMHDLLTNRNEITFRDSRQTAGIMESEGRGTVAKALTLRYWTFSGNMNV
jgi:hypothetical protein